MDDQVGFVGVYFVRLNQRYTSRGDPRPPSWGVLYDLPNENASSQLSTRFSPSPALGSSYCQLVDRCALVAYTILPYYYPTRSRVSTRSSLCPTAVLLHPLAQYVDPFSPACWTPCFTSIPVRPSTKRMLTEFQFVRSMTFFFSLA